MIVFLGGEGDSGMEVKEEAGGWEGGEGRAGGTFFPLHENACALGALALVVFSNKVLEGDGFVGGVGGEVSFNCFQEFQVVGGGGGCGGKSQS